MASGSHNILANMGFTPRSMAIERRLDSFVIGAHGTVFLSRLKTLLNGFRSWRDSLACFDGDINKAIDARGFLAEIEKVILNMDGVLNTTDGTAVDNEAFQREAEAFNQALHALIKLFPRTDAQNLRAQELANSVQDDARHQEIPFTLPPEALEEEPMPTRTDSAPPDLDSGAEELSPYSQPSMGGYTYGNFNFSGYSRGRLGDVLNLSTGSPQDPREPQRTASGSTYGHTTASGYSVVHAGNVYTSGNIEDPMYQNLNPDALEPDPRIRRSKTTPAGTSAPSQTGLFRRWRNRNEPRRDEAVH